MEDEAEALERRFSHGMKDDVTLLLFVEEGAAISKEAEAFAEALAAISPRIRLDIERVKGGASRRMAGMKVAHVPCLVLVKGDFSRIKYYGVPSGYELAAFADAIVELSAGTPHLVHLARESLAKVAKRRGIIVLVRPSCVFCPALARHSYRAAIGSHHVTTEIFDICAFPEMAARHSVISVPKLVLNESLDSTGVIDEVTFFQLLRDADLELLDSMFS